MADFNALNAKIDEVATEITAAVERVGTDVDELKTTIATLELDADDQAKVDEAVAKLDGHVQALKAIDPVKVEDVPPTDEPTDPTEPVEPPTDPTA